MLTGIISIPICCTYKVKKVFADLVKIQFAKLPIPLSSSFVIKRDLSVAKNDFSHTSGLPKSTQYRSATEQLPNKEMKVTFLDLSSYRPPSIEPWTFVGFHVFCIFFICRV